MSDQNAPAMRTLQLAAALCGGAEELAGRLGVSDAELTVWLSGQRRPPNDVFFAALDIVAAGPLNRARDAKPSTS